MSRRYSKNAMSGYRHEFHHPETHAPHIHRVFGNLETWLNGTHHGVDAKYLQNYLDAFIFRFNRRQTPMAAFQTLLDLTTQRPGAMNHEPSGLSIAHTARRRYLLAFSCKGRWFCPSCHQKKVQLFGALLAESILSLVPHRHLMFGIPKMLRPHFPTTAICSKTSAASPTSA